MEHRSSAPAPEPQSETPSLSEAARPRRRARRKKGFVRLSMDALFSLVDLRGRLEDEPEAVWREANAEASKRDVQIRTTFGYGVPTADERQALAELKAFSSVAERAYFYVLRNRIVARRANQRAVQPESREGAAAAIVRSRSHALASDTPRPRTRSRGHHASPSRRTQRSTAGRSRGSGKPGSSSGSGDPPGHSPPRLHRTRGGA